MKLVVRAVNIFLVLVMLAAATVFGNTRKSTIVFSVDTKVNDTIVKKGNYEAVYDEQSGELSIFKGTKLIAKTAARLQKRDQKARITSIQTILEDMNEKLVSVTFSGSSEDVLLGSGGHASGWKLEHFQRNAIRISDSIRI